MGKSAPFKPLVPEAGAGSGCPRRGWGGGAERQRLLRSRLSFTLVRGLWQVMIRFRFLLSCSLGMFSLASCVVQHESLGYKYIAPCLRRLCGVFLPVLLVPLGSCGAGRSVWNQLRGCRQSSSLTGTALGAARGPSRALLDFQMRTRAHGAVLALCTRGRGGFCSGEPATSPASGAQGRRGAGARVSSPHPEGLRRGSVLEVPMAPGPAAAGPAAAPGSEPPSALPGQASLVKGKHVYGRSPVITALIQQSITAYKAPKHVLKVNYTLKDLFGISMDLRLCLVSPVLNCDSAKHLPYLLVSSNPKPSSSDFRAQLQH